MRGEFAFSVRRKLRTQNLQRRALRIRRGVRRLCETVDDCFSRVANVGAIFVLRRRHNLASLLDQ